MCVVVVIQSHYFTFLTSYSFLVLLVFSFAPGTLELNFDFCAVGFGEYQRLPGRSKQVIDVSWSMRAEDGTPLIVQQNHHVHVGWQNSPLAASFRSQCWNTDFPAQDEQPKTNATFAQLEAFRYIALTSKQFISIARAIWSLDLQKGDRVLPIWSVALLS